MGDRITRFFYGYVIVVAGFFVLMTTHGTLYSFGVFLKPLSAEFGWTRTMTSGAFSLGLFGMGLFAMLAGRLNDRFGPRTVVAAAGLFLGSGCLLTSRINTLWQLYLFWGLIAAVGFSGGFIPITSTVARWFVERRGIMTGIAIAGVGAGTMIVPTVASWLMSSYDWRMAFMAIGITALVLLVLLAQFLKRAPVQVGQQPYGANELRGQELIEESTILSIREATSTKELWIACVIYAFFGFSNQTVMVHIVPHATELGIQPTTSTGILAAIGGFNIVGRVIMGYVSDKLTSKWSLVIGLVMLLISLLSLQFITDLWMFYFFGAVFGFCGGGLIALESLLTAELFGVKAHGTIMGTIVFSATSGGAIGAVVSGRIFDISADYYLAFLLSAVLVSSGLVLSSLLRFAPRRARGLKAHT